MPTRTSARPIARIVALAGTLLALTGPVAAQSEGGAQPEAQIQELSREQLEQFGPVLRDFIHFILVDRADVAAAYGQQLIDSGLTPTQFVNLVDEAESEGRFLDTIARAMRRPELEPVAARLLQTYERGKLDRVRDPEEVAKNISLLTGSSRNRLYARERLAAAGEYALPQLLNALLSRDNPALQAQVQRLLIDMGRHSVMPLATSLAELDPSSQERVIEVLGLIPYKTSVPYLVELRSMTGSPQVRQAIDRALTRLGAQNFSDDSSELYLQLAEGYYNEKAELTSFPGEDFQLLWDFNPSIGLVMQAIRTPVYHEAMAMRLAEKSLNQRSDGNLEALSLWIAANFSREIDTPEGYVNPAYPADRRDANYFAVAAGATPSQRVLARALSDRDTPLARRAIAAIERTAGGSALWEGQGDRRPLLEALRYPSRRVQYEAALALAAAQPTAPFDGSDRVVPTLASAIRDAAARFAVVVTSDQERYQEIRRILEGQGYTVLPRGGSLDELAQPIAEVPGIDLVVATLGADQTSELIGQARSTTALMATPILALTDSDTYPELSRRFGRDATVAIRPSGISAENIGQAATDLVEVASGGPVTEEEANEYAARALAALRDLAVSGNEVFDVGDAALPLIAALSERTGPVRLEIAEVLSRIPQKRAQVALADAALGAEGDERISLLEKVASSSKRFGNMLERRQVARVVELAQIGEGQEATAAAGLMGALNLPNSNLIPLILEQSETASR